MPSRRSRTPFVLVALLAVLGSPLRAQEPAVAPAAPVAETSPIRDIIDRMRLDINDFKYAEARRRGNELLASFASAMRPAHFTELRQVMAAAFYPDEAEAQQPDSAIAELVEFVKLVPDGRLATELRWAGLDSLLEVARSKTFAVAVRHGNETTLVGPEGRGYVDVVATRPTRFAFRIATAGGTTATQRDTAAAGTKARMEYRGHDGKKPLMAPGEYDFVVTAFDVATGDSVSITNRGTVTGEPQAVVPPPTFNEALLKPEYSRPPRAKMVVTGIIFSAATIAMASSARAEEPIKSAFPNDGRATMVSVAMIGAVVGSFFLDKGRPIRENMTANATARADHRRAVTEAEAESARRIAAYRVSVRINPEVR